MVSTATIESTVAELAAVYSVREQDVFSLLMSAIGKVYDSRYPACIWTDGSVSVIGTGGVPRTIMVSQSKYTAIMNKLDAMLIDHYGRTYESALQVAAIKNQRVFYGRIRKIHDEYLEVELFKSHRKHNNVILDNVVGRVAMKDLLPNDAERNIIREGYTLMFEMKHKKLSSRRGVLHVTMVRRGRKIFEHILAAAVEVIEETAVKPVYLRLGGVDFRQKAVTVTHIGAMSKAKREYIIERFYKHTGFRVVFSRSRLDSNGKEVARAAKA